MSDILEFLPRGFIFETRELRAMGEAFDNAMLMSPTANHDSVAAAIFRMAQRGERDTKVLCETALRASATLEEVRYLREM